MSIRDILLTSSAGSNTPIYPTGWTRLADLPRNLGGSRLHYYNKSLYIATGGNSTSITNGVFKYDLFSDTWSEITVPGTKPAARRLAGTVLFDDNIFVYGGNNNTAQIGDTWVYNISSNTWASRAAGMVRHYPMCYYYQGLIHCLGGFAGSSYLANHTTYNPTNNTWANLSAMPAGRVGCGFDETAGDLYYYGGGTTSFPALGTMVRYRTSSNQYTTLLAHFPNKYYNVGGILDNDFYSFGDINAGTTSADTFARYSIASNTWEDIPLSGSDPINRAMASGGTFSNYFFMASSFEPATEKELWVYNPSI